MIILGTNPQNRKKILDQKMINLKQASIERKRRLRIPYSAKEIFSSSLNLAKSKSKSRYIGLPESLFTDEVKYYNRQHKEYKLNEPRPILRNEITKEFAEEQAIKIDSGLKFLDLAHLSDPNIKPILLYYSAVNILSVLTNSLFRWEKDQRNHGINCNHPSDITTTRITISQQGLFPRLAATFTLLTGDPNCFSNLATYTQRFKTEQVKVEVLKRFGQEQTNNPIKSLSIEELLNFDYTTEINKLRSHFGIHKYAGGPANRFLIDILILFTASSISRYNVLGWQEILKGKQNPYILKFEEVFERFNNFTIDLIFKLIEDPFINLNSPVNGILESPYTLK